MWPKFKYFDPTKDQLPFWPYSQANAIAWRARAILRGRSREQIADIYSDIDAILDSYFDHERTQAIDEIRAAGRNDLLKTDEDGHVYGFEDDAYDDFNIREKDNTSELEALQESIDGYFDTASLGIENLSEHEYFAVFALAKLDDYFTRCEYEYDIKTHQYQKRVGKELERFEMTMMADDLIEAIDAINYSEKLKEKQILSKRYEEKIRAIEEQSAVLTQEAVEKRISEFRAELQEEEKKIRKEKSAERNDIRHENNRAVKQMVLDWFDEDSRAFPSAEKAADDFCVRLAAKGKKRSHRTVAEWIRRHARDKGIRFRP